MVGSSFIYLAFFIIIIFLSVSRTPRKIGMLPMGQIFLLQIKTYLSIYHNTLCDVTLTGFGVVWWHQKDPLGAVSAGFH